MLFNAAVGVVADVTPGRDKSRTECDTALAYLFAKKGRANIDDDELADFKKLAQGYGRMTDTELRAALNQGDLLELCYEE
jgi:hypothetical protein